MTRKLKREVWSRDTAKKEENRKSRKKGSQRSEANEIVCQGLSLVPIHRDTQIDLKIEKGGVVKGHSKKRRKIENQEKKEAKGLKLMKLSVSSYQEKKRERKESTTLHHLLLSW